MPARLATAPYQASQATTRPRQRVLADLEGLSVRGAAVTERGSTYLVFGPPGKHHYGAGLATVVAAVLLLADLVLVATSVLWVVLLPAVLLAYLPLLLIDRPMLAVGAVDDGPGETRITVHGHAWGDLADVLDAYLGHLPGSTPGAEHADADPGARPDADASARPDAGASRGSSVERPAPRRATPPAAGTQPPLAAAGLAAPPRPTPTDPLGVRQRSGPSRRPDRAALPTRGGLAARRRSAQPSPTDDAAATDAGAAGNAPRAPRVDPGATGNPPRAPRRARAATDPPRTPLTARAEPELPAPQRADPPADRPPHRGAPSTRKPGASAWPTWRRDR